MPDRQYYTRNHPPKIIDHFFAHFGSAYMALWSIVFAMLLIFAYYIPGYVGYIPAVDEPEIFSVRVLQALVIAIGNIYILVGIFSTFKKPNLSINRFWRSLFFGFILAGFGWLSHLLTLLVLSPLSLVAVSIAIFQLAFCATGYYVTLTIKDNIEYIVEKYLRVQEELR